jgi:hypothetical protein
VRGKIAEVRGQIAEVNPLAATNIAGSGGFHLCNLTSDLYNRFHLPSAIVLALPASNMGSYEIST